MAYTKQNFVDGKVLSAAQLNHMEDGIAASYSGGDLDMGASDINNAENIHATRVCTGSVAVERADSGTVFEAEPYENGYAVICLYGVKGDEATILRYVAPGVQDSDAVNVGQLNNAVGDIEAALDGIVAIQEDLIGVITFTFYGSTYKAVEGMTWGEWVESEYNIDGWSLDGDYVSMGDGYVIDSTGNLVTSTTVIVDGNDYDFG